jgi:predicted DNA binding protein
MSTPETPPTQPEPTPPTPEPVVDPYALTPKQRDAVLTAVRLGYYNTPRDATLDTLAEVYGVSKAAIHNRLAGAERKILTRWADIETRALAARAKQYAALEAQHAATVPEDPA